jgi:microcystin degradation protein MlrC
MRVAIAGIAHETNTFSPIRTDLARFNEYGIVRGEELVAQHAQAHTTIAGFLTIAEERDVEVVPLVYAWANPAGPITTLAFETLTADLLAALRGGGPWDAVLLAQHGAAVSDDYQDADLEIVSRVRDLVGPHVPIGVALDMHANTSSALVDQATIIVGFRTNPHIDARERAAEVARLITECVRGTIQPTMAHEAIPAVINIVRQSTLESPMFEIMAAAASVLAEPGILSVTVAEGYPYADVEQMGMSCLVVADGSPDLAAAGARRLANAIWAARREFQGDAMTPKAAIESALEEAAWPTVLLDVGDNIGAGGPGTSTVLLEAAIAANVTGFLVILHDRAAVDACVTAGTGATLEVALGRSQDALDGRGGRVRGSVRAIGDGLFEEPTPTHGGFRFFDAGATAVLDIGNDNLIVLTSKLTLPTSLQQLISLGIVPEDLRIIVAKGVVSPQAAYSRIAKRMILVDTAGVTSCDLEGFDYQRRRRPLHPFEPNATFPTTTPSTKETS